MDLRQLKTFRAVAELGSLSKASDRLRIAQPALSRQIKLLEHDLKAPLFTRHGRGMALTDAGKLLFERTSGLVRQLEQAREDVRAAAGAPSGRVVLGMVPTIGSALALKVARGVVDQCPGVMLRVVEAYASYLTDWLHKGEIDLAVIYGPAGALHLSTETLRHDDLFAIGPAGCGFSAKKTMSLAALSRHPLVLPSAPHALRLLVDDAFAEAKAEAPVRVEANSFQALVDMVVGGIGCTVLPYYAVAAHIERGDLEAARIAPALKRELVLALAPRHRMSHAARNVAKIVRLEVQALAEGAQSRSGRR